MQKLPKLPNLPDLPNLPNLPNVPGCVKDRLNKVPSPSDLADRAAEAGANAILAPLAEGIAKTTNQLIQVMVVGWLNMPSVRLDRSGVWVQPDQSRGTRLPNGGCLEPVSNAPVQAPALPPGTTAGVPGSGGAVGAADTSCGQVQALTQLNSVKLHSVLAGVGAIIASLLLLLQAIRTAMMRKSYPLVEALQGLALMAIMAALGLIILNGMLIASDALTEQILASSLGKGLGERVAAMLGLSVAVFGPVPVILFGAVIFILGLVQLIMLFFRQAAIPVLAMLMPVAAAGQVGGRMSRQWLVRLWTSLIAIVVYKPLAALIFAVGFLETGEGRGFFDIVRGLVTLALAIIALPMLMRVFTPIVGQRVGAGFEDGVAKLTGAAESVASLAGGALENASSLRSLFGGRGDDEKTHAADPASYEQYSPLPDQQPEPDDTDQAEGDGNGSGSIPSTTGGDLDAQPVTGDPTTDAALIGAEVVDDKIQQTRDLIDQQIDNAGDAFADEGGVAPSPDSGPADQPDQFAYRDSGPDPSPRGVDPSPEGDR